MRVLQLISSGGMYGAEAVILHLSRSLVRNGHDSIVGVFANGNVQLHHESIGHGLRSELIACRGPLDRNVLPLLRQFVVEHGIDLVHSHGYKADVYAYLALRGSAVPLVSTCHSWHEADPKSRVYAWLDCQALRRFDAVIAVSSTVQEVLLHSCTPGARVHLIPNGIDPAAFEEAARRAPAKAASEPLRVGLIGRLAPEKGIDIFLRAVATVMRERPGAAQFLIAGDGPERSALETLTSELELTSDVTFLGRVNRIPEFLASLDVVVSSSRKEGLPIATLESMAAARPIVATTVGEHPLVLDGGRAGMLVAPGDVRGLADAMLRMLCEPGLRAEFAAAAQQRLNAHYTDESMAAAYLEVYQDVFAGSNGRGS